MCFDETYPMVFHVIDRQFSLRAAPSGDLHEVLSTVLLNWLLPRKGLTSKNHEQWDLINQYRGYWLTRETAWRLPKPGDENTPSSSMWQCGCEIGAAWDRGQGHISLCNNAMLFKVTNKQQVCLTCYGRKT